MIIAIGHSKGGVGKSTISWNLANALKDTTDEKVTIIDLDFQQTIHFINSINNKIDVLQIDTASELIEILEDIDGYVVVDMGGFDNDINRTALSYANRVIVPLSISATDVIGFQTFKDILEEINLKTKVNILINNIHPNTKDFSLIKDVIAEDNTFQFLNTIIFNRAIYKTSLIEGKSVLDYKNQKAKDEILGLKDELL